MNLITLKLLQDYPTDAPSPSVRDFNVTADFFFLIPCEVKQGIYMRGGGLYVCVWLINTIYQEERELLELQR